ncbi:ATP-grasp fold amidoligase family protein [Larsenimonas rhizosphaerae]|uniref:ATP-grasp fold amidoligase family protein n=1 Tax=Larsenimonas rhizosphaerae TaxID=2944682 RepID=A0AA41ZH82_9GAMM|nr:ATP-grasp fold amidoligase family protein [Larsenimonas rhizosphaerae]MCM2131482.1 hypothetical protein [Larsenimonas rhizosphaerae]MCX2525204.1 ATP-grasp fold amidoligase family protein [Larsenimonas rhizosphaerae]
MPRIAPGKTRDSSDIRARDKTRSLRQLGKRYSPRRALDALMAVLRSNIMNSLSDRLHVPLRYKRAFGEFPNLRNPKTFNEKICYRKLHPEPVFSILSDKVEARSYVKHCIGEQNLTPCLGVARQLTPELFDELPNQFVMKASHGSGFNLLVDDKRHVTFPELYNLSQKWLSSNFYTVCRENQYKPIEPRLIFEKLLLDESGKVPKDYKFHCFQKPGEEPVIYIEISHDRFTNYRVDFYDSDWKLVRVREERLDSGIELEKPHNLDAAMELALKLARGFSYVRVDFYLIGDDIYFGEMTFTPMAGLMKFDSRELDEQWGALFD